MRRDAGTVNVLRLRAWRNVTDPSDRLKTNVHDLGPSTTLVLAGRRYVGKGWSVGIVKPIYAPAKC